MTQKNLHPGKYLSKVMIDKGLSQRELALKIDVAHSLLSNILSGNRNININIALSLEALNLGEAEDWMTKQMLHSLNQAKNEPDFVKKSESIKVWDEIGKVVPISFLKKQDSVDINSYKDIDKIYDIYKVDDLEGLITKVKSFNPTHFRKSSMFAQSKVNVVAWSLLAEYRANKEKTKAFNSLNEASIIDELKKCFYHNINTVNTTKKILNKYGIKFFIQDRPSKTPVDGKSFLSGKNPAIVLTLKYKRLDNFAFTVMHELGHVFKHLTKSEYKFDQFYVNNSSSEIEEFEANTYARNHLISPTVWDDFLYTNESFEDNIILKFSQEIKVHSGIIRGRLCFEKPEYYRKRTGLSSQNVLSDYKIITKQV